MHKNAQTDHKEQETTIWDNTQILNKNKKKNHKNKLNLKIVSLNNSIKLNKTKFSKMSEVSEVSQVSELSEFISYKIPTFKEISNIFKLIKNYNKVCINAGIPPFEKIPSNKSHIKIKRSFESFGITCKPVQLIVISSTSSDSDHATRNQRMNLVHCHETVVTWFKSNKTVWEPR